MDFKRKSVKKKQVTVKYVKIENINCLVFTLDKPFYQIVMGATNTFSFCDIPDIAQKVCAIFRNSTHEYIYCLEQDIQDEIVKMENNYLKG